jgi:hypothetical protein
MWMSGSHHQMIYYGIPAYLLRSSLRICYGVLRNRDVRRRWFIVSEIPNAVYPYNLNPPIKFEHFSLEEVV